MKKNKKIEFYLKKKTELYENKWIYNNFYTYVLYNNYYYRYYPDNVEEKDVIYSEFQVNILKLLKSYNFKAFHFTCEAKTDLKITLKDSEFIMFDNKIISPKAEFVNLNDKVVNLKSDDVIKIKELLGQDLMYLYEKQLFEVIYTSPKLNQYNNYYFDFIIISNKNFDLNYIYKHNFNLIVIKNVNELNNLNLTHNFIKLFFENRFIFNNWAPICESSQYDLNKENISIDDYIKIYNNGDLNYNYEHYKSLRSFLYQKNFKQKKYLSYVFKLLDTQIWSMDRYFVSINNDNIFDFTYIEEYGLNSLFLTSSYIKDHKYSVWCLYDWVSNESMISHGLNKFYLSDSELKKKDFISINKEQYKFLSF